MCLHNSHVPTVEIPIVKYQSAWYIFSTGGSISRIRGTKIPFDEMVAYGDPTAWFYCLINLKGENVRLMHFQG